MSQVNRRSAARLALCAAAGMLTGCQGALGTPNAVQVRVIDASPDAPMLDVYQGPTALSYNLAFGNVTSYIAVSPGSSEISASVSGSRQSLSLSHETLAAGQYTLLVGNTIAGLQQTLLKDQNTAAPAGQVALRFVNQATAPGAFDLYLVPPGTAVGAVVPLLTAQAFGGNSGYLSIPAGSYRIVLYPAGAAPSAAVPPAYSGITVSYPSGAVRTVILLDQRIPLRPAVQMVIATDADLPAKVN